MAERINCPNCGKELKVPSRLVGRKVVCPRCSDSFRLSSDGDGLAPPQVRNADPAHAHAETDAASATAAPVPNGKIVLGNSGGGLLADDEPSSETDGPRTDEPTPPPIQSPLSAPKPAAAATRSVASPVPAKPMAEPLPDAARPADRSPEPPPITVQADASAKTAAPIKAPTVDLPAVRGAAPRRKRKSPPPRTPRAAETAKFVAAEATETRVRLGEDGKLPDLVLQVNKRKVDEEPTERNSNPLLLLGVLCLSIGLSVVMLLYEPGQSTSTKPERETARELIRQHYTGSMPDLKPHEELLREALRAHNREDYAEEQRLYRQVLEMLRDESHRGIIGLTRRREGMAPPSDRHLEEQLSILLRKD